MISALRARTARKRDRRTSDIGFSYGQQKQKSLTCLNCIRKLPQSFISCHRTDMETHVRAGKPGENTEFCLGLCLFVIVSQCHGRRNNKLDSGRCPDPAKITDLCQPFCLINQGCRGLWSLPGFRAEPREDPYSAQEACTASEGTEGGTRTGRGTCPKTGMPFSCGT